MAPYLRDRDHLSLAETGFLISSSLVGSLVSLIPWGLATDRIGERLVLFVGLMVRGGGADRRRVRKRVLAARRAARAGGRCGRERAIRERPGGHALVCARAARARPRASADRDPA